MAKTGNRYVAYALALSLLASGAYVLVHGWLFGNIRSVSWKPRIAKTAMAEGNIAEERLNHTFSLFSENIAEALKSNALEGAMIILPGSDDTYIFVSETEDAVTWTIDKKGISVTIGSIMDEDGKPSDYIGMSHSDSKKKITRSLKKIISEDGKITYLISKTEGKKTAEFPLTAGQFAEAEQELSDPKNFDLIIERENILYLFRQEAFDYLDGINKGTGKSKITYPDRKDTYLLLARTGNQVHWNYNENGMKISYGFKKDEKGKNDLVMVMLYNYPSPDITQCLVIRYSDEGEPFYSICRVDNSLLNENRITEYPLTPDQFVWAFLEFKKNPKKFDSIFEQAPQRSSSNGNIIPIAIGMTDPDTGQIGYYAQFRADGGQGPVVAHTDLRSHGGDIASALEPRVNGRDSGSDSGNTNGSEYSNNEPRGPVKSKVA